MKKLHNSYLGNILARIFGKPILKGIYNSKKKYQEVLETHSSAGVLQKIEMWHSAEQRAVINHYRPDEVLIEQQVWNPQGVLTFSQRIEDGKIYKEHFYASGSIQERQTGILTDDARSYALIRKESWYEDGTSCTQQICTAEGIKILDRAWYPDGSLKREQEYNDTGACILHTQFHPNGIISYIEKYRYPGMVVEIVEYHADGSKKSYDRFCALGKEICSYEWYDNHLLKSAKIHTCNEIHYHTWRDQGQITMYPIYMHDKHDVPVQRYESVGPLESVEIYTLDNKIKKEHIYYSSGEEEIFHYDHNEEYHGKQYKKFADGVEVYEVYWHGEKCIPMHT
ncbi:MAG: hypothetical protein LRY44_02945 [Candidatus Pacebacteria bacterium]|nr:hypothetical protein [Candidatus Paceibacterota bacterium]MCD8563949.1 hypothetical protein [Candidatus Paceibacterota bacterium]